MDANPTCAREVLGMDADSSRLATQRLGYRLIATAKRPRVP